MKERRLRERELKFKRITQKKSVISKILQLLDNFCLSDACVCVCVCVRSIRRFDGIDLRS